MRISDWSSDVCSSDLLPSGTLSCGVFGSPARKPSNSACSAISCASISASCVLMRSMSARIRSEEHTSELQSLMRISYAVFCLKKKKAMQLPNYTVHTDNKSTEMLHEMT